MQKAILALALAASAVTADAQAPAAWFGTWRLDLARSTYIPGPPPYKRASYRIEPWQDGLKVVYDMVLPRGGVTHLEWTGRLDGREYPVQGVEEHVTYAYTAQADGTYAVVVRLDGRVAAQSTVAMSADGGTMTTRTVGRDARGVAVTSTTVYERQ